MKKMIVLLLISFGVPLVHAEEMLSLGGEWRFQLDRTDAVTLETKWSGAIGHRDFFAKPEYAPYRQPGNVKLPFFLQPEKHYVGAAWYQRDIEIPQHWQDRRVVLTLERPHWETQVWVDDRPIGMNNSLSTPHDYDLGTGLTSGKHRLTIRVDNRHPVDITKGKALEWIEMERGGAKCLIW